MDKNTVRMLATTIFKKVDAGRVKDKKPDTYYLENFSELKDIVQNTLQCLGVAHDSDDVELVTQEVMYTMSIWAGEEDGEDDLFGMDLFLGDLDSVMLDVNDMFKDWSSILVRTDILIHKDDILESLNSLLEEIYARRTELEEIDGNSEL